MYHDSRHTLTAAIQVLQAYDQTAAADGWYVEPMCRGGQATIFRGRRRDGQPVWRDDRELIVKLFDPAKPEAGNAVEDEYATLERLQATIHGRQYDDWRVVSPVPLYQSRHPLAIVMTRMPGESLHQWLRHSGRLSAACSVSIAQVLAQALRLFWSKERRIYGDLRFQNILCDLPSRQLVLLDSGAPESYWRCDDVEKQWYPVSRDLAYLVFSVAVGLKATLGHPGARSREKALCRQIVAEVLAHVAAPHQRSALADETRRCARLHESRISTSLSPTGIWRNVVKRVATQGIDEILRPLMIHRPGAMGPAPGPVSQELPV